MLKRSAATDGYILIALALLLLWIGAQLRPPLLVSHKIIVAKPSIADGTFKQSVVFVFSHDIMGAAGIILNKPSVVAPIEPDNTFALHSSDVSLPGSLMMADVNLGLLLGTSAVGQLKSADIKPKWHIVTQGYAGWSPRQLDREIRRGHWKVIDYDPALVMTTDPEKMWQEANKRPDNPIGGDR